MRQSTLLAATVLASLALVMLGRGITGLVVSETCCIGPTCIEENMCDEHREQETETSSSWFVGGVLILFVSFVLFISVELTHRRH